MNTALVRRFAGAVESTGISNAMPAPMPGPFDPYVPVPGSGFTITAAGVTPVG